MLVDKIIALLKTDERPVRILHILRYIITASVINWHF